MNTVKSHENNVFFPVICIIKRGGGVRPSVMKCEIRGEGGFIPKKGVISYLKSPIQRGPKMDKFNSQIQCLCINGIFWTCEET